MYRVELVESHRTWVSQNNQDLTATRSSFCQYMLHWGVHVCHLTGLRTCCPIHSCPGHGDPIGAGGHMALRQHSGTVSEEGAVRGSSPDTPRGRAEAGPRRSRYRLRPGPPLKRVPFGPPGRDEAHCAPSKHQGCQETSREAKSSCSSLCAPRAKLLFHTHCPPQRRLLVM